MIDFEEDMLNVTTSFLESSEALADAAALCEDDPIKQDMISFIQPHFLKMCAKSEGIRLLAEKSYNDNRNFILQEMKEVTKLNFYMAEEIKKKLEQLASNEEFN